MQILIKKYRPVGLFALLLAALVTLQLAPYRGNATAMFHMDRLASASHRMPVGFVIIDEPAYDGAHYYLLARDMPLILTGQWAALPSVAPGSYAYQRFLLPLLAWVLALGKISLLPFTFSLINLSALLLTCFLILQPSPSPNPSPNPLHALALALSPAAVVALHFSLAEPLTLLLLTFFLIRFVRSGRVTALDLLLLSLLTVTREINILFVMFLAAFLLWKRSWRQASSLIVPVTVFLILHTWIAMVFGNIPFLISAGNRALPFSSPLTILLGGAGLNRLTFSSIVFFLLFFLPAFGWILHEIVRHRQRGLLPIGALCFLLLMSTMSLNIWGSITSIGRVITPVYPLILLHARARDTAFAQAIAMAILGLGLGIGVALALRAHPYMLS